MTSQGYPSEPNWGQLYALLKGLFGVELGDLTYPQLYALIENAEDLLKLRGGGL